MRRWNLLKGCAVVIVTALVLVGCAATSSQESTGAYLDDAAITTKVKSSFVADLLVSALAINVQTSQGVVHLTGTVNREPICEGRHAIAQALPTNGHPPQAA